MLKKTPNAPKPIHYFVNNKDNYNTFHYITRSSVTTTARFNQIDNDILINGESNDVDEERRLKSTTVLELKEKLRCRGLKVSGLKNELIERLLLDSTSTTTAVLINENCNDIVDTCDIDIDEISIKGTQDDNSRVNGTDNTNIMNNPSTPITKTKTTLKKEEIISNIVTPDIQENNNRTDTDVCDENTRKKRHRSNTRAIRNIMEEELHDIEKDVLSTSKYRKVSIRVNNSIDYFDDVPQNNAINGTITKTLETKKRQRKLKLSPVEVNPPEDWKYIYSLVEELRKDETAPVDSVGAEELPERHRGEVIFRYVLFGSTFLT